MTSSPWPHKHFLSVHLTEFLIGLLANFTQCNPHDAS